MATRKLEKAKWKPFLDVMSETLVGKRAEIEVDSLSLGSQIEAEWMPLLGITYDPKNDLVEVTLDGLDHLIHRPRELNVDVGAGGLTSIEVVDAEGVQQIIRLRDAMMLPPP